METIISDFVRTHILESHINRFLSQFDYAAPPDTRRRTSSTPRDAARDAAPRTRRRTSTPHLKSPTSNTKMKTKTSAAQRFKAFYDSHKDEFPYNQVRCTRHSIYSKWLLVETRSASGIRFYRGRLFAMLSNLMDKKTVQRMIVSRRALPLPDSFCSVMDSMYHWGRCVSPQWYQKTLELLKHYLLQGNNDFQRDGKSFLYREVIRLRVFERLHNAFPHNCSNYYNAHRAWGRHYKERVEAGESDFFMIAASSFEFLSNEIHRLQEYNRSLAQLQSQANSAMNVVSNVD